jgi:steroid 5-alpha reductase family enzyme
MKKDNIRALAGLPVILIIAGVLVWAGSQGGAIVNGLPLFTLSVMLAFIIQWIVFIPAFLFQTEKFYDLTGSLTYLTVSISALLLSESPDSRAWLLLALIVIWAVRLGSFLFTRVLKSGKDSRFDDIKPSLPRFLLAWTLQGLWISFTLAAALAAITSRLRVPLDFFAVIGLLVWITGFSFEVIADWQKNRFRADTANKGRFIRSGLWSWSRHPNYFGEITLWTGVAIIALPVLRGWQFLTLISPVFIFILLTRISGIPMLEQKADEKWGGQADYEQYKSSTSVLVPLPPRKD